VEGWLPGKLGDRLTQTSVGCDRHGFVGQRVVTERTVIGGPEAEAVA
jgi:hypothetical protein